MKFLVSFLEFAGIDTNDEHNSVQVISLMRKRICEVRELKNVPFVEFV